MYRAHGLVGLLGLVYMSIHLFWDAVKPQLRLVLAHGLFNTMFTVAALFLLVPMIKSVSRGSSELGLGPVTIHASAIVFVSILILSVILLGAALRSDYRAHIITLEIQSTIIAKSATMALVALLKLPPERRTRIAVRALTGSVASSAGFMMRKVASVGSGVVKMPFLFVVLLWIQPLLTVIAAFAIVPVLALYSRSIRRIAVTVQHRKAHGQKSSDDVNEIVDTLQEPSTTAADVESKGRLLIDDSSLGESVRLKELIRRERRRGPTTIASAFPMLLAVLAVAAYVFGMFEGSSEWIFVYVMVLRHLVGVVQGLSASMIAVARFQDNLVCLFDLLSGEPDPGCYFFNAGEGRFYDDEDDEDDEDD
jgi:ABC-type multidrug transport system fused ATPase/permease subunit